MSILPTSKLLVMIGKLSPSWFNLPQIGYDYLKPNPVIRLWSEGEGIIPRPTTSMFSKLAPHVDVEIWEFSRFHVCFFFFFWC